METRTIVNPKTNRNVKVTKWTVDVSSVYEHLKALGDTGTAKDVSWFIMSDKATIEKMDREQNGDSTSNNFALGVFENGLDWGIGLAFFSYLNWYKSQRNGKRPKTLQIAADRKGRIYIIRPSQVILWSE